MRFLPCAFGGIILLGCCWQNESSGGMLFYADVPQGTTKHGIIIACEIEGYAGSRMEKLIFIVMENAQQER
jgi:hypothetical protein